MKSCGQKGRYWKGSYEYSLSFDGAARFAGDWDYPLMAREILARESETRQSYQNEI